MHCIHFIFICIRSLTSTPQVLQKRTRLIAFWAAKCFHFSVGCTQFVPDVFLLVPLNPTKNLFSQPHCTVTSQLIKSEVLSWTRNPNLVKYWQSDFLFLTDTQSKGGHSKATNGFTENTYQHYHEDLMPLSKRNSSSAEKLNDLF